MAAGIPRVLDHRGNPLPPSLRGSYEGAASGRRMGRWGLSTAGPSSVVSSSLATLRARSRELARNNAIASSGIESFVADLVGTGITPRWLIEDQGLKREIQDLWALWTDEADAAGLCDFYGLQALAARSLVESGEVLARFRGRLPDDGLTVPLQLQILECDHLDESYETVAPGGNPVRMGIELDALGRRAAYWLFRDHPGESFLSSRATERVRVPASEVLHVFRPLRPGQMRGCPWLASVIATLHELDQYEDAELVRKKCAAMFGGFITQPAPDDGVRAIFGAEAAPDALGRAVTAIEPGTFPLLPPGVDVTFSNPADVGETFEPWIRHELRKIAAGVGVTYEKLSGDLSGVNFSSIRAGLIEFRRRCEMLQWHVLVHQLCRPVAARWLDTAVASGALRIRDYAWNRAKYLRIDWRPQGWPWVDPVKEVMAAQLAVRAGFKSRSAVIAEQGYDAETVDAQIAEDARRADELGLVFDSDPRRTSGSGSLQDDAAGAALEEEEPSGGGAAFRARQRGTHR